MNILRISLIAMVLFSISFGVSNAQVNLTDVSPGGDRAEAQDQLTTQEIIDIGNLRFYTEAAEFNQECPVLAFEDFEDTDVPPNSTVGCPEPMNSQSNDLCYAAGALIPGFSITTRNAVTPGSEIVLATPPFMGLTNVAVGANTVNDDTIITFTDTVNSAGLLLVGALGATTVEVEVYGINNTFLGSIFVDALDPNGTFIGVQATQGIIERIELIENGASNAELMYDLSFGLCNFSTTRAIPTLSEWGLIAMVGIIGIVGLIAIRKRAITN